MVGREEVLVWVKWNDGDWVGMVEGRGLTDKTWEGKGDGWERTGENVGLTKIIPMD